MTATIATPAIDRTSPTELVAAWCIAKDLDAEVVGAWVWVTFDEKPSAELREELKSAGFRWVRKRGQWAHNCGVFSRSNRSDAHPRTKYGSIRLRRNDEDK